jgi:hypothetical protein
MASSKGRYGVVTGITNIVVEAAMHGGPNPAADALVGALNKFGITATRQFANSINTNSDAVHILIGLMQ